MYHIKEIAKEQWEPFVLSQPFTPFVQSYKYGEFYRALGEQYWLFGVYEGERLVGGSLVVSTHAKRGHFLYLPYGPLLDFTNDAMVQTFFSFLQIFARQKRFDFIRVSPWLDDTQEGRRVFKKQNFINAPMHALAETSWILDLAESEEIILSNMKKNHRNLIHRCEREGVQVMESSDRKGLQVLSNMLDETEKRHDFTRFSQRYVEAEFQQFSKDDETILYVATLPDGRVDAAAIMIFYGNMAVYRHSGSLGLDKRLPSSYLIQWKAFQEAKRRGIRWYNFWGVAPTSQPKHPFAGIGHFKRGFGGFPKDLLHCQDLPITKKYWLNWTVETIRRYRRGFV